MHPTRAQAEGHDCAHPQGFARGTVWLTCCLPLGVQAKKQLGWEPKVALREGLSRMVSDFAKRLDVPVPDVPGRPA